MRAFRVIETQLPSHSVLAETELLAKRHVRIKFGDRPFCVRDKLNELTGRMPRLPFGNVCWNGDSGTAHLRNEPESFL